MLFSYMISDKLSVSFDCLLSTAHCPLPAACVSITNSVSNSSDDTVASSDQIKS